MPGESPSELQLHYGSKAMDGELIKRPSSPPLPSSPSRTYHSSARRPNYSPERTPVDPTFAEAENVRAGLRRRPSNVNPIRRHSGGEYDSQRPSHPDRSSTEKRPMRTRDDGCFREEDRPQSRSRVDDHRGHPDIHEKTRPPRSYRNIDARDRGSSSASKPYFDESGGDYRGDHRGATDPDLERGEFSHHSPSPSRYKEVRMDQESIDGYNYDQHKHGKHYLGKPTTTIDFQNLSPEERKQVMRLPWTQWMNSDIKNCMSHSFYSFAAIY